MAGEEKKGRVVWFSPDLGYGFIRLLDKSLPDAYFHWSELIMDDYKTIKKNRLVSFICYMTRQGTLAKQVRPL